MPRAATALLLLCLVALVLGCGGRDAGSTKGPDSNDRRAGALACLTREKRLPARDIGSDSIQVADPATGPRIKFFLTGAEAEAKQFEGGAEGSEQIGAALLFVRHGSERLLGQVEDCLDKQ